MEPGRRPPWTPTWTRGPEVTARNRIVLVALPLVALAIGFWVLVLAPKREEATALETRAADLRVQVDEQEQLVLAGEAAREDFPSAYRRLVVLGKAAPEEDDTSSLLVQLEQIARGAKVNFIGLDSSGGDETAAPTPTPTPQTPAETAEGQEERADAVGGDAGDAAAATPPPATEAEASLLPIGATIGPAGLPVMRYTLNFEGDFFRLADFVAGLDALVRTKADGKVGIRGRLVTIDDFDLAPTEAEDGDALAATFTITTYLTPAEQGVTAGASPSGPAPAASEPATSAAAAPPAAATTPPVTP